MTTTPGSDYDVAMTTPERSDDEMDRSAWNSAPSSPQSPQTSPTAEKEATFIEEFKNKVLESKADQWLYTSSPEWSPYAHVDYSAPRHAFLSGTGPLMPR